MSMTPFMVRALAAIVANGGEATPAGGGFWNGADGCRLEVEPSPGAASGIVGTNTIQALLARGRLRRTNRDARSWWDTLAAVETGL